MRDVILTSSVLILAILAIRAVAKGKIPARLQYALWLLAVLRLLIPGSLGSSPISVLRIREIPIVGIRNLDISGADTETNTGAAVVGSIIADTDADFGAYTNGNMKNDRGVTDGVKSDENISGDIGETFNADKKAGVAANLKADIINVRTVIYGIWVLGIMITGGYMLIYQIRFAAYIFAHRKSLELQGEDVQYYGLQVYTVKGLPSPCLFGKRIYLTEEMAEDKKKLTHILAHEYCHYRQLDPLWAIVRCVLVSVYWFHPLVWAAAYISRRDSEFACDEAAILLLGEGERFDYGRTLLSFVREKESKASPIGPVLTMSSSEKGMKERIGRIAKRPGNLAAAGGLVLITAALFAVMTFTSAGQEKEQDIVSGMITGEGRTEPEVDAMIDSLESGEYAKEEARRLAEENKLADAEAEARRINEEQAVKEAQNMINSQHVIHLLSSYDQMLINGGPDPVTDLPEAAVHRPSDLLDDYLARGEEALSEGIYFLAGWNGKEGQSMPKSVNDVTEDIISVYGLYTKEYGLRGIKVMVGEGKDKDVNNFDIPWSLAGVNKIHVFDTAPEDVPRDHMPRTFAFKQLLPGTEKAYMNYGSEIYELYVCDRYDTGHIILSRFCGTDYAEQIGKRISCRVNREERKVYVYDNNTLTGAIDTSDVPEIDAYSIQDALVDTNYFDFTLGNRVENIRLNTVIRLRIESKDRESVIWRQGFPVISFPTDSGYFGSEREFTLGQATVDPAYTVQVPMQEEPFLQSLSYANPCPDYTRVSDGYGSRMHPITGEVKVHDGIDLAAEQGAAVLAAAEGTVYETGYDAQYGNYVVLHHAANDSYTCYTHCRAILAAKDSQVTKGQQIAKVGSTGMSTGAHLHFAVYQNGGFIEPVFEE